MRLLAAVILSLSFAFHPFLASAQSLSPDDSGTFGRFDAHTRAAQTAHGFNIISGPPALLREGQRAFLFDVRPGDCGGNDCREDRERVERVDRSGSRPRDEHWYAWSLRLADDFPFIRPTNTTLGQFKQEPQGCEVAGIGIESRGLFFYNKLCAANGEATYMIDKPFISLAAARGRWIDFMVHSNWSADSDGFLDFYVDGRLIASHRGRVVYNNRDEVTFRFGIYRSFVSRYTGNTGNPVPRQWAIYDNVRRGDTRGSVEIQR
ncbi:Polysaccharide lyase [Yoonia litorea]|uniref:Polysaccharide lyase n=2 Tax=Yoonia litorea TaxID=1123755 RepID=A0A1I6N2F3_9RHOB|nr:Polysaccharide lyase [Yoonia litorea]